MAHNYLIEANYKKTILFTYKINHIHKEINVLIISIMSQIAHANFHSLFHDNINN